MQAEKPALFAAENGIGPQAVVFVHGFGADHRVWSTIAAPLATSMRTLAYDLPGHGQSLGAEGAGSAKNAARAIVADLSRRGIGRAHVIGHSMGGAVAALMAMADPARIASLTLLAPGGFGPEINGPLLRRYARALDRDELGACLAAMSGRGVTVSDARLDSVLSLRERPGQIEKLVEIAAAITRDDRRASSRTRRWRGLRCRSRCCGEPTIRYCHLPSRTTCPPISGGMPSRGRDTCWWTKHRGRCARR